MATGGYNFDDLEEKLSCSVCFETYNDADRLPKALACMHTLCLKCLGSIKRACPTCRADITNVSELKTNFALLDLLPLLSPKEEQNEMVAPKCRVHKKSSISHYCLDCYKAFCDKCFAATVRKASSHFGHNIVEFEELQVDLKEKISQLIRDAEDKQSQLRHTTNDQTLLLKLTERKSDVKKKIADIANHLHIMVDVWQSDTNCDVESIFEEHQLGIETKTADLEAGLADHLDKLHEAENQVSKGASIKDLVEAYHQPGGSWDMSEALEGIERLSEPVVDVTDVADLELPKIIIIHPADHQEDRESSNDEFEESYEPSHSGGEGSLGIEPLRFSTDSEHSD